MSQLSADQPILRRHTAIAIRQPTPPREPRTDRRFISASNWPRRATPGPTRRGPPTFPENHVVRFNELSDSSDWAESHRRGAIDDRARRGAHRRSRRRRSALTNERSVPPSSIKLRQTSPTGDERHNNRKSGHSGRQPQREPARRPVGTFSSASDIPTPRIQTASLEAELLAVCAPLCRASRTSRQPARDDAPALLSSPRRYGDRFPEGYRRRDDRRP